MKVLAYHEWSPVTPNGVPNTIRSPQTNWLHFGAKGKPWHLDTAIGHARYHIETLEWLTVGYTALVVLKPEPMLLLGRVLQEGAHTQGYNDGAGICVPGNVTHVPREGKEALAEALRIGRSEGWWPDHFTGGHRDVSAKPCPGTPLYDAIPEVNRMAANRSQRISTPEEDEVLIKFEDPPGRINVLYSGSGRIKHLSGEAYEAVNALEAETDQVVSVGKKPGLAQAGFTE